MNMPTTLALLVFAAWSAGAAAQGPVQGAPANPPQAGMESAACRDALAALQAEEAQGAGRPPPGALAPTPAPAPPNPPAGASTPVPADARVARLQALRERASRACLGGPAGRPVPAVQAPQPVPPVSRPAPAPPGRAPLASPPPPPVVTSPAPGSGMPLTVVACDSTGCTASDGTRLNKVGPTLVGPKGACTLEGAVLRCPQ